jgi:hypothetical protein
MIFRVARLAPPSLKIFQIAFLLCRFRGIQIRTFKIALDWRRVEPFAVDSGKSADIGLKYLHIQ